MASEDMDSLTFGAPRFLRHLMDPSSRKVPVMEFEVAKVHTTHNSTNNCPMFAAILIIIFFPFLLLLSFF